MNHFALSLSFIIATTHYRREIERESEREREKRERKRGTETERDIIVSLDTQGFADRAKDSINLLPFLMF